MGRQRLKGDALVEKCRKPRGKCWLDPGGRYTGILPDDLAHRDSYVPFDEAYQYGVYGQYLRQLGRKAGEIARVNRAKSSQTLI